MKTLLRPNSLGEVIRKLSVADRRRDVVIDPEGGLFGVKNLATAIRRSGRGDVIHVPGGEYQGFELLKALELRSLHNGPLKMRGTMRIQTDGIVVLSGMTFLAEPGARAIELVGGTLFLDDCSVQGEIAVGSGEAKAELFVRNCLIGNAAVGVDLLHGASVEIHTSRITGCRVGIALRPGTTASAYDSRIEACLSVDEADPGAGISAENAAVYCEGVTFARNTIGIYLKNCTEALVVCTHFHACETSALIAANDLSATPLHLHTCTIDGQVSSRCAQISLTGGAAIIDRTEVGPAPASALAIEQTRLQIRQSTLRSTEEPALDARSSHVTADRLTASSTKSAGFAARACQGILRQCVFSGRPPTAIGNSMQLVLEACASQEDDRPKTEAVRSAPSGGGIADVMQSLQQSVSQEVVRNELERILRLAHAGQQRRQGGLPVPHQSYHSISWDPPAREN